MARIKRSREEYREQIQKRHYESSLRSATDERYKTIERITARLHKINLSGKYNYPILNERVGPLLDDNDNQNNQLSKIYDRKYIRNFSKFNFSVFVNPIIPTPARCFIWISPKGNITAQTHKEFLQQINKDLPDLKVSSVEYAIDLFCSDPLGVKNLYWNIIRHLFVPYQRKVSTPKKDLETHGKMHKVNCITRFGATHKAYERGRDDDKDGEVWREEDLNRVRLEFTAKHKLREHKISFLNDLIEAPKFFEINNERWKFQQFTEGSKDLPSPWEPYIAEDESGWTGIFQQEVIQARKNKTVKNIAQSKEDVQEFYPIEYDMAVAMTEFDDLWGSV